MKRKYLLTVLFFILVWQIIYLIVDNKFLIDSPINVFSLMLEDLTSLKFYTNTLLTMLRVVAGLSLALVISTILCGIARNNESFSTYFRPIVMFMRSVPNVSYVILFLIWFGSEFSVILLSFFVVFPVIYLSTMVAFDSIPYELTNIKTLFSSNKLRTTFKVEYPLLKYTLAKNTLSAFALSVRSIIMAEILVQVRYGMGHDLNIAKLNVDMTRIFSETLWIVIITLLVDVYIINLINKKIKEA